jgi:CRP-like cAMP-binding protein
MAMLIETQHSATVLARTSVKALRISKSGMHRQMSEDRELAHHFVDHISGRLSRLAAELRQVDGLFTGPAYAAPSVARPTTAMPTHPGAAIYH